MKNLLYILCLLPSLLYSAVGDVTNVTVLSGGTECEITVEGFTTGAQYDFDYTTDNTPSATSPFFTVVSEYDDPLVPGTFTRTVYITAVVRKAHPDDATLNEIGGGNLTTRFSLSEPIFLDDNTGVGKSGVAPTVTLKAGFIVNLGGASQSSAAYTGGIVTQNSTAVYASAQCIANWSIPAKQLITGSSFTFRVCAYQLFGQQGRPVRAVKFTITDASANLVSSIVTSPTWSKTEYGDLGPPIIEYMSTLDLSPLNDGEVLTCRFQAYPWVGDSTAVRDSSVGPSQPTPLASNITMFYDESGSYERRIAVVDSVNGNDATGATVTLAAFDPNSPPAAYKDIESAAEGLDAAMTRSDIGGCFIYLRDNAGHAWTGGTVTASARNCYVTVKTFPLDTRASLTSNSGSQNLGNGYPIKLEDLTIQPAAHSMFGTLDWLWMDDVNVNDTTIRTWYLTKMMYFTRCLFTRCDQDVGPYSTENTSAALVRGSLIAPGFSDSFICPWVFIGNATVGVNTRTITFLKPDTASSTGIPNPTNMIVAYNSIRHTDGTFMQIGALNRVFTSSGWAVVQNLLERTNSAGLQASVSSSTLTGTDLENIIFWNNTMNDWKTNWFYNDTPGVRPSFKFIAIKNSIIADYNIKTDDFANDSANVNNWQPYYGVLHSGNLLAERPNSGAPQLFNPAFFGLKSPTGGNAAHVDPRYITDASIAVSGAGNGNYRLKTTSPAYRLQRDWLLPYDITGKPRSPNEDSAGAYSEGGVRQASMFFAN